MLHCHVEDFTGLDRASGLDSWYSNFVMRMGVFRGVIGTSN